jgi:hypothetical protein
VLFAGPRGRKFPPEGERNEPEMTGLYRFLINRIHEVQQPQTARVAEAGDFPLPAG